MELLHNLTIVPNAVDDKYKGRLAHAHVTDEKLKSTKRNAGNPVTEHVCEGIVAQTCKQRLPCLC